MKSSLNRKKKEFSFGSFVYRYELIRQDRKTLSLTVAPDLNILVKCPHKANDERVELFLKKKWFWLEKQLTFFGKFQRKQYKKEYISGESFYYLGRQYQLIVQKGKIDRAALFQGKLLVETRGRLRDGLHTKKLIEKWYKEKTKLIFDERLVVVSKKFKYGFYPDVIVKPMDKRWGSALRGKKIILNPKLIQASKECIDYVITHELCHFTHKNHGKEFWKLLEKMFPKWERVKNGLELKHG